MSRKNRHVIDTREKKSVVVQSLRMVTRAIAQGWDVPAVEREKAIRVVCGLVESMDDDVSKDAIRLLLKADEVRLKAMEMQDKAERLDNESATEIIKFKPLTFGHTDS